MLKLLHITTSSAEYSDLSQPHVSTH